MRFRQAVTAREQHGWLDGQRDGFGLWGFGDWEDCNCYLFFGTFCSLSFFLSLSLSDIREF